ncbi:MAG: type III-A CRISPR-associated RAMP protein Csm5 [Bryobacterales bacterium]|nr:type III-A CRISPR-associated RAMP protein Csm5 [Bryobacterales bacterium]
MKYRVSCLTPTLVGDGQKLSPIDYMVWKDHVNVLDQRRIIKLLAKGPRLDSYLTQVRRAEKLDFASWGGFAQNFAGRRIPFEHSSLTAIWEKQRADTLFIPTFASGAAGPYLPASALRGALHTAYLCSRWTDQMWKQVEDKVQGDRFPRRPAEPAEDAGVGLDGHSRMRSFAIADSSPVAALAMKVYMLRTSTLAARGQGRYELGWKPAPYFCEMAPPGSAFEGSWSEKSFLSQPEVLRALRWREAVSTSTLLDAANSFAAKVLAIHRQYAATTGLQQLDRSLASLESTLAAIRESGASSCLLSIGWGGGFLSKTASPDTGHETYRRLLRQMPFYSRAIQTGLPFPKTRRVVFQGGEPAALPGWVLLEVNQS